MKRFLLPLLLVLCAALTSACSRPENDNNANANANANGNKNAANVNQNAGNVNQTIAPTTRDPKNKAVMITVYADAAGRPQVAVAPNLIRLIKNNGQQLRFYVFNNLDADLKEVKIEFKSGDPMDGTYTFGAVPAGTDAKTTSHGVKPGQADGKYKYTITVTIDGVPTPVVLDPEVEVATVAAS